MDRDWPDRVPVVFTSFVAASFANGRLPVDVRGIVSCAWLR